MNEISIQLNPHQLSLFKATREEYAKQAREIANIKQAMKDDVDGLISNMKIDKKKDKELIKAIKQSLKLYVNGDCNQLLSQVELAVEMASL